MSIMTKLPRLYKITKTGAIQICDISYLADVFSVTFGQLNGKLQTQSTTCYDTNQGRSNHRDPSAQAKFEALAKHKKKIDSGYTIDESGEVDISLPMKVKIWQDVKVKNRPAGKYFSTPKLNGVNGTYRLLPDDSLSLTSRGGLEFPAIPHLEADIRRFMSLLGSDELNGELFIPDTYLEDITSAVKATKPLSLKLEFAIFDMGDSLPRYEYRRDLMLKSYVDEFDDGSSVYVLTGIEVSGDDEIESHYNQCMSMKCEGTVIKHADAPYEHNVRSSLMWKYKKAIDSEFKVFGHELDKHGHVVYICHTHEGKPFKVKRKGTAAERLADAKIATKNYGRWLKVEFESWSKKVIPLKPVGLDFRDMSAEGKPLI